MNVWFFLLWKEGTVPKNRTLAHAALFGLISCGTTLTLKPTGGGIRYKNKIAESPPNSAEIRHERRSEVK
jgi:hypothetical protein